MIRPLPKKNIIFDTDVLPKSSLSDLNRKGKCYFKR